MVQTVFITGAGSGIGAASARLFAQKGWQVIATMRNPAKHRTFDGAPNITVLEMDVTHSDSIRNCVETAIQRFESIDVVVNNAGYFQMGPLETSSMDQIRRQYDTNVFGLIEVTKAFVPHFRSRHGGMFINVASISAENGYPFVGAYASSKAAVLILTEALHIELESIGATAKAILPGTHATRIFTKIDMASTLPEEYRHMFDTFTAAQQSSKGSHPSVGAKEIYEAATDRKRHKVRYYAGPDAENIPSMKRLMGERAYFRFFKRLAQNGPGPIMRMFQPQGTENVEVRLGGHTVTHRS